MTLDLSNLQIAAVLATYFFAATAKGVTGLGFSTTCLPILTILVGLKDALPLVIIPSICSNLVVMRQAGHFAQTIGRFWPMLLALLPGLVLGLWILLAIEGVQAAAFLGIVLLLWCAFSIKKPDVRIPEGWESTLAPVSGFLTGMINGMTGSQVMPSVPFLMMLNLERDAFIQAVNCSFTLSSVVMAFGLGQLGLFSQEDFLISAFGTGCVFFGVSVGGAIRERLSETLFRNAILAMLALMGLSLVLSAFL